MPRNIASTVPSSDTDSDVTKPRWKLGEVNALPYHCSEKPDGGNDSEADPLNDVAIITGLCDHNDYLIDYTTPFEVQIGNFTLFHSGDCCSHTKLHVLRRPDLWVFHPYCGMDPVAGCREAINPKLAVIAHLQELGHAKGRYRWTYYDGLRQKAADSGTEGS